jgi:hypothetical protein
LLYRGSSIVFFAKNLGCRIIGSKATFDISPLAKSIVNNEVCDSLFLSIGFIKEENNFSGGTNLQHGKIQDDTMFWKYIYGAGKIYVEVIYSIIEPEAIPISFSPQRASDNLELAELK